MSIKVESVSLWSTFFLAAGASNVGQALIFHWCATPTTSAATLLGKMGSKVPKPSHPTWAVVTLAGGAYAWHGLQIGEGKNGLHWGAIATFAALKFAVAKKMYTIATHPKGRPGAATAFIGITEVMWGGAFAYWAGINTGYLK
ncbi:hypothetical protein TrLO_g14332 [Triparma laevis f. longispina]|uniref:Uncharacterized protein n=1 Tax=Triparma laevis f. longispina TaxID=1714387 RepID=A0A9W6ZK51_9STRA|nr:hypothetical protein TrLO_g14332 [Triparma laevis f. longispina]